MRKIQNVIAAIADKAYYEAHVWTAHYGMSLSAAIGVLLRARG